MQTYAVVAKKIDDHTLQEFHEQLMGGVPEFISADDQAYIIYKELVMLVEGIITDKAAGLLGDTRAVALATFRRWEEKLQQQQLKAEAKDKMNAQAKWREWALEASMSGAAKAHRWTKLPAA